MNNRFSYYSILLALILLQCLSAITAEREETAEHHIQFYPVNHDQYDAILHIGDVANAPTDDQRGSFLPFVPLSGMMPSPGMMIPPSNFNFSQNANKESLFRQTNWGEAISESLEWVMKNVGHGAGLQTEGFPLCVVQFPEVSDMNSQDKEKRTEDDIPAASGKDKAESETNSENTAKKPTQPVVVCVIIMRDGRHKPMNQLSGNGANFMFNRKPNNNKGSFWPIRKHSQSGSSYQKVPKRRPNKNKKKTTKKTKKTKRRKSNKRPSYSNYGHSPFGGDFYGAAAAAGGGYPGFPLRKRRLANGFKQLPVARQSASGESVDELGTGKQYGIYPSPYGPYGGGGGGYTGPFVNPYGYPQQQHPFDSGEEEEDDEGSREDSGENSEEDSVGGNSEENSGEDERAFVR